MEKKDFVGSVICPYLHAFQLFIPNYYGSPGTSLDEWVLKLDGWMTTTLNYFHSGNPF